MKTRWDTARPWVEALIAAVQEQRQDKILRCIEQLKAIFDEEKLDSRRGAV